MAAAAASLRRYLGDQLTVLVRHMPHFKAVIATSAFSPTIGKCEPIEHIFPSSLINQLYHINLNLSILDLDVTRLNNKLGDHSPNKICAIIAPKSKLNSWNSLRSRK